MRNAKTTKEIYEALIQKPDLHSIPEMDGDILIWQLYKDAYVWANCNRYDTYIEIVSTSLRNDCSMHWHPDEDEMLDELYTMGKKGNILVIKKTLFTTKIFYMGEPEQYPLSDKSEWHFGKKWGDEGSLIYLEQK